MKKQILRLRLNSFLLAEGDVEYAAWLLRPEALGAPAQNDTSINFDL
jgi:hypothetical protein